MNIFIYWQIINYLQSHTLSTRYNYLLAIIYKLQFISNIIYNLRLLFISQKLSAKTITTIPTNKDPQLRSIPINTRFHQILYTIIHTLQYTSNKSLCVSLSLELYLSIYFLDLLTHVLSWFFAGSPSYPLNKDHPKADMWNFGHIHPDLY